MTLYAESSAVLAWLLGDEGAGKVESLLAGAGAIVASKLTIVQCERVLLQSVSTGEVTEARAADHKAVLNRAAAHWTRLALGPEVLGRTILPFPVEPSVLKSAGPSRTRRSSMSRQLPQCLIRTRCSRS